MDGASAVATQGAGGAGNGALENDHLVENKDAFAEARVAPAAEANVPPPLRRTDDMCKAALPRPHVACKKLK